MTTGRLPRPLRGLAVAGGLALYLYLGWWQPLAEAFVHDYAINWAGARLLLTGGDLYDRAEGRAAAVAGGSIPPGDTFFYTDTYNSFIQPPIGAIASAPFAPLDWPAAKLGWLTLNHLGVWLALALLWRLAGPPPWWPEATALILGTCRPLHICFYYGQADGLILLWLTLGLWALVRVGRGLPGMLGVALALGLAATWKLSPVFIGLGFLKARRVALAFAFGAAAALWLALQFAVAGAASTRTFFAEVLPQLLTGSFHYVNVSLPGWAVRLWAGPAEAYSSAAAPALPPEWRLLQLALMLGVLGLAFALSPCRPADVDWPGVLGLWLAAGVLVAAVAWEHYQSWVLVGIPWALARVFGFATSTPDPSVSGTQPMASRGIELQPCQPAGRGLVPALRLRSRLQPAHAGSSRPPASKQVPRGSATSARGGTRGQQRGAGPAEFPQHLHCPVPAGLLFAAWILLAIPLEWLPLEWRTYLPLKALAGLLLMLAFGGFLRAPVAERAPLSAQVGAPAGVRAPRGD